MSYVQNIQKFAISRKVTITFGQIALVEQDKMVIAHLAQVCCEVDSKWCKTKWSPITKLKFHVRVGFMFPTNISLSQSYSWEFIPLKDLLGPTDPFPNQSHFF